MVPVMTHCGDPLLLYSPPEIVTVPALSKFETEYKAALPVELKERRNKAIVARIEAVDEAWEAKKAAGKAGLEGEQTGSRKLELYADEADIYTKFLSILDTFGNVEGWPEATPAQRAAVQAAFDAASETASKAAFAPRSASPTLWTEATPSVLVCDEIWPKKLGQRRVLVPFLTAHVMDADADAKTAIAHAHACLDFSPSALTLIVRPQVIELAHTRVKRTEVVTSLQQFPLVTSVKGETRKNVRDGLARAIYETASALYRVWKEEEDSRHWNFARLRLEIDEEVAVSL